MGLRGPKPVDQDTLEYWYAAWLGVFHGMRHGRYIRADLRFEPESVLWLRLLKANKAEQIKGVCNESPFWLNAKRGAIIFRKALLKHSKSFLLAKKNLRWPMLDRPTNDYRRIKFLARTMAGAMMGISIRTAQDLLGKTDKDKLDVIFYPVCNCGHLETDHTDRSKCMYCMCTGYRYSGGRERIRTPET
jgi:hypothetical protein